MNEYDIGDVVRMEATFKDKDAAPVDPTAVVCRVKKPDGTTSTPAVTNEAPVGEYSAQVAIDMDGTWRYRFEGTGTSAAAEEGRFYVRRSAF